MTTALLTDAVTGDASRAVRLTLLWGLDAIALRTLGGGRVPNVTEGPIRRRLAEAELPVAALDPGLFEGDASARAAWLDDLGRLDETAQFATRSDCALIRIGALATGDSIEGAADALRQAGDRAERLGLTLAVCNDAETAVPTGAALADLLSSVGHDAVRADWRPADALVSGEAPADGLAALLDAAVPIACVGARDGTLDGAWTETIIGQGDIGWDEHLATLAASGFDGPLILEAVPEPVRSAGLRSATALIRLSRR